MIDNGFACYFCPCTYGQVVRSVTNTLLLSRYLYTLYLALATAIS